MSASELNISYRMRGWALLCLLLTETVSRRFQILPRTRRLCNFILEDGAGSFS